MNDIVFDYIQARRIDSFQKLYFLLFFHRHSEIKGTIQEFAERLYIGDIALLERIITDLHRVGLVDYMENCCKLRNEPDVKSGLQCLAGAFADPLTRQEILDQVRRNASFSHH